MLNHDVLRVDHHAVGIGAVCEMVIAEHAEKLRVEKVPLLRVASAGQDRHAKQLVGAVSVADRQHRRL